MSGSVLQEWDPKSHSPRSVPIFLSNLVEKCSKSVLALYLSVCISIIRGDKRCTFLYVVLWAKAPLGKCMVGPLSAPACHLGWIEVGICQWPPDFLCLYARRGQRWSGKSIHKVLLLGPGDGECKKLPILAKSWQIQKIQLCGILPLLLSIQGLSREKNYKKKSVDLLATENICCEYFPKSNELKCIGCLATLSNVGGPGKFKDPLLPFLENKHHKFIYCLCLWIKKGSS